MRLIYKIEFKSTNSYLADIINDLIVKEGVKADAVQYAKFIAIICDDEQEKIESFFKRLEASLPISLFISKAEVIDLIDPTLKPLEDKGLKQNISISNEQIIDIYQNSDSFGDEVEKLLSAEIIEIETNNGTKRLSLPTLQNRETLGSVKLLVVNLNALSELVEVVQNDLTLLSAIERPVVKLKFNLLQNRDKEYSNTNFIEAKLPDDQATYELATALRKRGVDFLIYSDENALQEDIKATYIEGENIIISGDKTLFPRYDSYLDKTFENSKEYFNAYGSVYKATLANENLRIKPSIGIYMSYRSNDSSISVNIPGSSVKDVIKVPNVYNDVNNALEEISEIDENTERLVENYKKRFASHFEQEVELDNCNGFESILNILAYVMGMKNFQELENKALEFNAKSGIQIDMKIAQIDGVNYLDYRKIIASVMSYKMADVQDTMLAFSVYESLSEFIVDQVNTINSELHAPEFVLCGDMMSNSILLSKLKKNLTTARLVIPSYNALDY